MDTAADSSGGSGDEGQVGRRDSSAVVRISLILRIWRDEEGEVWGQVVNPQQERRTPFRGQDGLFQVLQEHMGMGRER